MDYMKLVADLCQIIDRQNEITKAMAEQLGQRFSLLIPPLLLPVQLRRF